MSGYDANFDVAIDILAHYRSTLHNVIDRLESAPTTRPDKIAAFRDELKKVNAELHTMRPDDEKLVNKANHIYSHLVRNLVNEYQLACIPSPKCLY